MDFFSVLVTGANRGIGLEFVRQFLLSAKPPKHIFATYRNKDAIQELSGIQRSAPKGVRVHLKKLDVRESSDLDNLRKVVEDTVGENGLTLLINNAGIAQPASFPDITFENLNSHLHVNTIGPILVAQAFLPLLKKAALLQTGPGMKFSRAGILNISSSYGSVSSTSLTLTKESSLLSYKISKAGLNMGTRVLAATTKEDNILIVNMCPGSVKTDMGTNKAEIHPEESVAALLSTSSKLNETHHGTFMDRFGNPYLW